MVQSLDTEAVVSCTRLRRGEPPGGVWRKAQPNKQALVWSRLQQLC
jgi:hypothetical protein